MFPINLYLQDLFMIWDFLLMITKIHQDSKEALLTVNT